MTAQSHNQLSINYNCDSNEGKICLRRSLMQNLYIMLNTRKFKSLIYTVVYIAVLFTHSCSRDVSLFKMPKFTNTGIGEFEVISDDLYFGYVVDLFIYESYVQLQPYEKRYCKFMQIQHRKCARRYTK